MTLTRCGKCDHFIDTDEDPDSTYYDPFLCEWCRGYLREDELVDFDELGKKQREKTIKWNEFWEQVHNGHYSPSKEY